MNAPMLNRPFIRLPRRMTIEEFRKLWLVEDEIPDPKHVEYVVNVWTDVVTDWFIELVARLLRIKIELLSFPEAGVDTYTVIEVRFTGELNRLAWFLQFVWDRYTEAEVQSIEEE